MIRALTMAHFSFQELIQTINMTIIMSISPPKNSANTTAKWTSKQDLIRMRRHSDLYSRGVLKDPSWASLYI